MCFIDPSYQPSGKVRSRIIGSTACASAFFLAALIIAILTLTSKDFNDMAPNYPLVADSRPIALAASIVGLVVSVCNFGAIARPSLAKLHIVALIGYIVTMLLFMAASGLVSYGLVFFPPGSQTYTPSLYLLPSIVIYFLSFIMSAISLGMTDKLLRRAREGGSADREYVAV